MGFLSSRFTVNSTAGQFHSSGMVNGDVVTGGGSSRSFNERQAVDRNRQTIARYRDSMVVQAYRRSAAAGEGNTQEPSQEPARGYARTSRVDNPPSSRLQRLSSSRIDIVKNSRQSHNAGALTPESPQRQPRFGVERPQFTEPQSRGYDPYR